VKVCLGQLYSLYCDPTSTFKGNGFWSFCRLVQSDHERIHLKWVTDYNTCNIEHFEFVLNGKETCAHWNEICPNFGFTLLVIQMTLDECKCKLLALKFHNQWLLDAFQFVDVVKSSTLVINC
jgi:hypothetical protein